MAVAVVESALPLDSPVKGEKAAVGTAAHEGDLCEDAEAPGTPDETPHKPKEHVDEAESLKAVTPSESPSEGPATPRNVDHEPAAPEAAAPSVGSGRDCAAGFPAGAWLAHATAALQVSAARAPACGP